MTTGSVLDAVRGLRWPARRSVANPFPGAHPSRLRGHSVEFTEYRLYRQGDDPRRLDWRLLARSDRPYVRLTTDRAVLPTVVLLDGSASMAFPTDTLAKWEMASSLAVALCAVAQGAGDPVGLVLSASETRIVAPRSRRDVLAEIARVIGAAHPSGNGALAPALARSRAARVAIVTDLLGDADALRDAARVHVVAGGEVHLVHVVAREELDPAAGARVVSDPEDPAVERTWSDDARRAYVERFAQWRDEQARAWRDAGAYYTQVLTGESVPHATRRIVAPAGAVAGEARA